MRLHLRIPLRLLVALALALGLVVAGCGGGSDDGDPPAALRTTTDPPVTSGPLARGRPEALVTRALRRLLADSYRAVAVSRVSLSDETDADIAGELRGFEIESRLGIEAESPRRRTLSVSISVGQESVAADIVEYDGKAYLRAAEGNGWRALDPDLIETLGGTGPRDVDLLLQSLGEVVDAGDGERAGQAVRAYEGTLDGNYLTDNTGFQGSASDEITDATARFELRRTDGALVFQSIVAQVEREADDDTLVADLTVGFTASDHGARIAVEEPTASGDPITSEDQLRDALL